MMKLYHAPLTRSARIYWLLEELGLPYQLETVAFTTPSVPFSQATPFGKLPALEDGDVTLFESGAILEWILERHGQGRLAPAPGTPERAAFLQWIHFADGFRHHGDRVVGAYHVARYECPLTPRG